MNKDWSEKNKLMQSLLRKSTFDEGIKILLDLRNELFDSIMELRKELSKEDYSLMPFPKANGYHCKTIGYSLWHIFRIEDICANTLIQNKEQVLFSKIYLKKTNAIIQTTGNELVKEEIVKFTETLDIDALFDYIKDVKETTDVMLKELTYEDLKKKFTDLDKQRIMDTKTVSEDENSFWLIDFWCGKDIKGLIQMPFSRHWIMHIEAIGRIKEKIRK